MQYYPGSICVLRKYLTSGLQMVVTHVYIVGSNVSHHHGSNTYQQL